MTSADLHLIASLSVPKVSGSLNMEFRSGTSIVLLGANGAGKTRLGVLIENSLAEKAHRLGAQRSLTLNTNMAIRSLEISLRQLRVGSDNPAHGAGSRPSLRWHGNPATFLLSDYDHLIAALYAEQAEMGVRHLNAADGTPRPKPRLSRLAEIWHELLPHRSLLIGHASVKIGGHGAEYDARDLSDGERVVFYLLGHALLATDNSVLVVDEPELHVNRAILHDLWDAIESERRDCCFVYVTHDLEMAAARRGAIRYAVEAYYHDLGQWEIEAIPPDIELPEELVAKIVGSRVPILFVEGTLGSLDSLLYRHAYPGLTVHGAGSCDEVIRSVQSFTKHPFLHRVGCAGLVDADDRDAPALASLRECNIHVLPVAEIENFMLLPGPFIELAKVILRLSQCEAQEKLRVLKERVFSKAAANLETTAIEAARRVVDSLLKRLELSKESATVMKASYQNGVAQIDPMAIYNRRHTEIAEAIQARNYEKTLALYANKGLFAEAAAVLGQRRDILEGLLGRLLGAVEGRHLLTEVRAALPAEADLLEPIRLRRGSE